MRDDRLAAMNFRDGAQVDRKCELDDRALGEAEISGFDEDAVRAQVVRSAERTPTPGYHEIHRGLGPMPAVQAALHPPDPLVFPGAPGDFVQYAEA